MLIENFIQQILLKLFSQDIGVKKTIISLIGSDNLTIGEVVFNQKELEFYAYEYSRSNPSDKWDVYKKNITLERFNHICGGAHRVVVN